MEGLAADGSVLFSHDFTPDPTEFGGSQFGFNLPYDDAWTGTLDRIVVRGPPGEAVLMHNSQAATAVVRNPESGQVIAITTDIDGATDGGGVVHALSAGLPILQGEIIR